MIKGAQCRAARALVDMSTARLAQLANVDVTLVQNSEEDFPATR